MCSVLICCSQEIVFPEEKQITNTILTNIWAFCHKYFFECEACSYALKNNCQWLKWIELSTEYSTYFSIWNIFKFCFKKIWQSLYVFCLNLMKMNPDKAKHAHLTVLPKFSFRVIDVNWSLILFLLLLQLLLLVALLLFIFSLCSGPSFFSLCCWLLVKEDETTSDFMVLILMPSV